MEAKQAAALALQHRDRLSAREQLYIDAARMIGEPVDAALEKWEMLAGLYPDFAAGPHNVGMYQWQLANRYVEAERAYAQAITTSPPVVSCTLIVGCMLAWSGSPMQRAVSARDWR